MSRGRRPLNIRGMRELTGTIGLQGELGKRFRFLGVAAAHAEPGRTVLRGAERDQAQIQGQLDQWFELGREVAPR